MSIKESLEKAFQNYNDLTEILNYAQGEAIRNPNFGKIFLSNKVKGDKRDIIKEHFDLLKQKITELCILDMIAAFEHKIFTRVDNAHGEIEGIVEKEYKKRSKILKNSSSKENKPTPFYIAASSFIKNGEDIRSLSGIKGLLKDKLPEDLSEELSNIIEYRNWLSHGKRNEVGKNSCLTIGDIHEVLNDIFDRTGNKIPEPSASEEEI